jgi:hypothetical protein
MVARALLMLMVMTLGACAVSGPVPDWLSEDVAGPEPAYRFRIANDLRRIVGPPSLAGTLEISGARRVISIKGASWLVCLKAQHVPLPPRFFAVFFQRGQIAYSRVSVGIDQCELDSYEPFNWRIDAITPPL